LSDTALVTNVAEKGDRRFRSFIFAYISYTITAGSGGRGKGALGRRPALRYRYCSASLLCWCSRQETIQPTIMRGRTTI